MSDCSKSIEDRLKETENLLEGMTKQYKDLSNGMHELVKVQSEWLKSKSIKKDIIQTREDACREIIFNLETLKLRFQKDFLWIQKNGCTYYDYESAMYELETLDEEIKKYYDIKVED